MGQGYFPGQRRHSCRIYGGLRFCTWIPSNKMDGTRRWDCFHKVRKNALAPEKIHRILKEKEYFMQRLINRSWKLFIFYSSLFVGFCNDLSPSKEERCESFDTLDREKAAMVLIEIMDLIRHSHVDKVDFKKLIQGGVDGMLSRMDPHSGYCDPEEYQKMCEHMWGEFGGLGMEVTIENGLIKVISAIDDTPASKAGLKAGDIIIAIDDTPVSGLTLYESVTRMRGKPGTSVNLLVKREGERNPMKFTIGRQIISIKSVKWRMEKNVGYIRISMFDEKTTVLLRKAIESLKKKKDFIGYVVDLRDNPGGLLEQAISVVSLFLDQGIVVSTKGRRPEYSSVKTVVPGQTIVGNFPVVILINEGSASASEIMAGALQDHKRAIIVGETSFGKGSVQSVIPLSNGKNGGLRLTISRFYTPLDKPIQGHGIKPDVFVEPIENLVVKKAPFSIREKNLARSLLPEQVKERDKQSILPEDGTMLDKNTGQEAEKAVVDYQLLRAIDIVKALHTFHFQNKNKISASKIDSQDRAKQWKKQ